MTPKQITMASIAWSNAKEHLLKLDPNLDKNDLEAERQELLKLAGSKPDENGRRSVKRLTNSGLSTFLDLLETTVKGEPNQKRRSAALVFAIENLPMPGIEHRDAYLDKIAANKFGVSSWRDLDAKNLKFLLWTAKARLRARKKSTA